MHRWFVYSEFSEASAAAADSIAELITTAIESNDACHVVLPGGNTPALCLSLLAKKTLPWKQVHWYLGDERCCPSGDKERNDVMLQKNLWSKISDTNIYPIRAEFGAETAARLYSDVISAIDHFDIAFLGMGEDGHTASLFPGNEALNDTRSVVPVYDSPKPPSDRVSLSIDTLTKTKHRIVLASGAGKAEVIQRIKNAETLPINTLGDIDWYVDEASCAAACFNEK